MFLVAAGTLLTIFFSSIAQWAFDRGVAKMGWEGTAQVSGSLFSKLEVREIELAGIPGVEKIELDRVSVSLRFG